MRPKKRNRKPARRKPRAERFGSKKVVTSPFQSYVSFSTLDPITQRVLVYSLEQEERPDPEMDALVRQAQDEKLSTTKRRKALHAIADLAEARNAADADAPATVSLVWPGGVILHQFAEQLERKLIPPAGPKRAALQRALGVLVQQPPAGVDPAGWSYQRAKRWVVLRAWRWAMQYGHVPQRTQIGSSSTPVTGIPAAGVLGYAYWLQQQVPKYAWDILRSHALGSDEVLRMDRPQVVRRGKGKRGKLVQLKEGEKRKKDDTLVYREVDWPATESFSLSDDDSDQGSDMQVVRLASVLAEATERQRQVLYAESRPERYSMVEAAADLAGVPLTADERRILAADPPGDSKGIARLIGLTDPSAEAMVNNARSQLRKKISDLVAELPQS